MSTNLRNFTKAVYNLDAVVARVPDGAWDQESPCEGWTARDVLGHQIGVLKGVVQAARGEDLGMPEAPDSVEDPAGAWAACRDEVLTALDQDGALKRSGAYWFGEMSVDGFIGVVQWDPLIHAWDLAKATGVEHVAEADVAASSLTTIGGFAETLRQWGAIGEPVDTADDADEWTRLLALAGRIPA